MQKIENYEDFRMGHLVRTAKIWQRLCELGANEDTLLDFDFSFVTCAKSDAEKLIETLKDYPISIEKQGLFKKTYTLRSNSGPIQWDEAQLLKWVDYLISVGWDANCHFQGCGASIPKNQT